MKYLTFGGARQSGMAPILMALLVINLNAAADTEVDRGYVIAATADRRDTGWEKASTTLRMVLTNAHGQTAERALRIAFLEANASDAGDKSLITFDEPRDVAGTAFLTHSKVLEPTDQWIYLPALRRVKRISSVNQNGSFMGSEFSYEDLGAPHVDRFSYRFLREEVMENIAYFVFERVPRYENSGYARQVAWLDTTEYRLHRIDFYDRGDDLLKTVKFNDYRRYLDKYWRAHDMHMVNHQTGKETRLIWQDFQFGSDLYDGDFAVSALRRIR
jgi:hypothetical protein